VIRTPNLDLPDPPDEVPADVHGICGPSIQTLRERWTGKSPVSVKAAAKAREEAEHARRFVRQAAAELRESYLARVQGRRPR
jgi:hypothetical protein